MTGYPQINATVPYLKILLQGFKGQMNNYQIVAISAVCYYKVAHT